MKQSVNQTQGESYAKYFLNKHERWWRFLLPVQVPYKKFARAICRGQVLDIGCGAGRYLSFLFPRATGVDHNTHMLDYVKGKGFKAFSPEDFLSAPGNNNAFDTLLFSHILEHMTPENACSMISQYIPCLRSNGRIVIILPQGEAFKTDHTHICNYSPEMIRNLATLTGTRMIRSFTFPFPEKIGEYFPFNDLVYLLKRRISFPPPSQIFLTHG